MYVFNLYQVINTIAIGAGAFIISHALYNVFLHPLCRFPGPKLWTATRIPWCLYQCRGTLHNQILQLHLTYGEVVRIAPNELSFANGGAWKAIYGHRKDEMEKDPIFRLHTPTGAQNILVADRETHTRQRRLLAHAFSESALREQEPILQIYANKLVKRLSEDSDQNPIDLVVWLTFASFDLIGHMSFGENFGCLDRGEHNPFVRAITAMASELTYTQILRYWGLIPFKRFLTPRAVLSQRVTQIKAAMETVQRRIDSGSDHRDFLHYVLSANDEKGMSMEEIHVNAFSLTIAGSESTATALAGAFFFVLTHPHVYSKLVAEIRVACGNIDEVTLASTRDLPYLDAVISETMRLYPPVGITLPRCVPDEGAVIMDHVVPGGITVGVHHYSTYHLPTNFHRSMDFLPERWLAETRDQAPFADDRKDCLQPFSFGPRNCLGKNIARAEMRLLFAKLLTKYDVQLVPGQTNWPQQKLQGFWQKKPLLVKISPVA